MGALLAMTLVFTRLRHRLFSVLFVSAIAACSNAPVDTSGNSVILDGFGQMSSLLWGGSEPEPITRATVANANIPVILVESMEQGTKGTAIPVAINQSSVTWTTANGVHLVFKESVLFSTRGLGPDLLTAETDQVTRNIAEGVPTADYVRVFRHVEGDEQVHSTEVACELRLLGTEPREVLGVIYETVRYTETCLDPVTENTVKNSFWIGAGGVIWDSIQWVSHQAGYLRVSRLVL